jgi:hypothetical protein
MSDGTIKQVKVDNWGIFFLQRLQQLFSRSEHCDLILHFSTNERIKVSLQMCSSHLVPVCSGRLAPPPLEFSSSLEFV